MVPLRVFFTRHGESQANLDFVFANSTGTPGDLTSTGIAQARSLASTLAPHSVCCIYTSPLDRARQTADILAGILDAPVTECDALMEYDVGDFEGLTYAGDDAWRWERYETIEQAWRKGLHDSRHPEGESLSDLAHRFLPFMSGLTQRHDQSDTLVAVGHGGLFRAVLPLLFDNLASSDLCNRPIQHHDVIIGTHEKGIWSCERWGDETFVPSG